MDSPTWTTANTGISFCKKYNRHHQVFNHSAIELPGDFLFNNSPRNSGVGQQAVRVLKARFFDPEPVSLVAERHSLALPARAGVRRTPVQVRISKIIAGTLRSAQGDMPKSVKVRKVT